MACPTTWFSCKKCVFCALRTVFPSNIFDYSLSCPFIPFSNPRVSHINHHCCSSFYFNIQEKGMGFLILTKYFMFVALLSWICELLLRFLIYDDSDMGWVRVC